MWELARDLNVHISWHFFASNHGKCRCDGHFGCSKCWHKALVKQGIHFDTCQDYAEAQNKYVPDTDAWVVDRVDPPLYDIPPLTKIKVRSAHRFDFQPGTPTIKAFRLSSSEEFSSEVLQVAPTTPEQYAATRAQGNTSQNSQKYMDFCKSVEGMNLLLDTYNATATPKEEMVLCDRCLKPFRGKGGVANHKRFCKATPPAPARAPAQAPAPASALALAPALAPIPLTAPTPGVVLALDPMPHTGPAPSLVLDPVLGPGPVHGPVPGPIPGPAAVPSLAPATPVRAESQGVAMEVDEAAPRCKNQACRALAEDPSNFIICNICDGLWCLTMQCAQRKRITPEHIGWVCPDRVCQKR
jgi:hypothetical protein